MNANRLLKINKNHVERIIKDLDIKKEDKIFAYIGELNKNKNQMLLIKTIEILKKDNKNVKLLLIGDGAYKEKYCEEIIKRGLEKNVFLLGKRSDIAEILSIVDIYLASSLREGLPVNVMEAIYMKIPVIATNNRGHRELVKEDYLVSDNPIDLKNKILNLNTKEYRNKINIDLYKVENILEDMKKIYGEVLN